MKLEKIVTEKAPAAIGPYSQGIRANGFIFFSGQIPLVTATGEMLTGDVAIQTKLVMENISAVLVAAGANFDSIVKTTIYLVDMGDFAAVNDVYGGYFGEHKPARSTVAVKSLPRGAQVEIEVIAVSAQ